MPDGLTLWIEKHRRSRFADVGPPTARATNWPGRASSATPGRDEGQVVVGPDPAGGDELAADLDDTVHAVASTPYRSRAAAWSCSEVTSRSPVMTASMACTAAASCCTVVMIGLSIAVVAARMA